MPTATAPSFSRNPHIVRDPTGQLAALLAMHIEEAKDLLADGADIDERSALLDWTIRFCSWRSATSQTLASRFDRLVVEEFDAAVETTALVPSAVGTMAHMRRAVTQAIELLAALRRTQFS